MAFLSYFAWGSPVLPFIFLGALALLIVIVGIYLYVRKAREADELKYEFITVATHKFRTPLTSIRWASESLMKRLDLPEDAKANIARIRQADIELIQLSNLLIDAIRTGKEHYAYAYADTALGPLTEAVLAAFAADFEEKQIQLAKTFALNLPLVSADHDRLSSAIHVLVENAIHYTPQGGTIQVTVTADRRKVHFSIRDSGIGISEEDRKNLFRKFYRGSDARRADTEGVGLGLSMARDIITRHGGKIGVESAGTGQGSEFWFTLPVKR